MFKKTVIAAALLLAGCHSAAEIQPDNPEQGTNIPQETGRTSSGNIWHSMGPEYEVFAENFDPADIMMVTLRNTNKEIEYNDPEQIREIFSLIDEIEVTGDEDNYKYYVPRYEQYTIHFIHNDGHEYFVVVYGDRIITPTYLEWSFICKNSGRLVSYLNGKFPKNYTYWKGDRTIKGGMITAELPSDCKWKIREEKSDYEGVTYVKTSDERWMNGQSEEAPWLRIEHIKGFAPGPYGTPIEDYAAEQEKLLSAAGETYTEDEFDYCGTDWIRITPEKSPVILYGILWGGIKITCHEVDFSETAVQQIISGIDYVRE